MSCQEYTVISTSATISWPALTRNWMPPDCMNVLIWSTSVVTRDTSVPRRSLFCVSTDRSCTWRNARVRSAASPASLEMYSRTFIRYDAPAVTSTATAQMATAPRTYPRSGPPGPPSPESMTCWTAIGTTTLPAVATSASSSVPSRPRRNSGDSARPRRSVEVTGSRSARSDRPPGAVP